jgi:general stress protein 26
MKKSISKTYINNFMQKQKYAVIATQEKNMVYTNLVAFFSSEDLKNIYFLTSKKSKKYNTILKNPNISVLIDDRKNKSNDIKNAAAITVIGQAYKINKEGSKIIDLFKTKHPNLLNFILSSDSVLIQIKVDNYVYVNNFEKIKIFRP